MADLGTLWFGADIDLTKLKQKIQSGNQGILDALKISYDPQSYQQMVSKLRSDLSKETFEIKISAGNVARQIQTSPISKQVTSNFGNLTQQIADQRRIVNALKNDVEQLRIAYQRVRSSDAKNEWLNARSALSNQKAQLEELLIKQRQYEQALRGSVQTKNSASQSTRQLTTEQSKLGEAMSRNMNISGQLATAFGSLFSLYAIRQFLNNVIEIGGQLERQRISIGAILGDTVKANALFERIKGLALKSPFGVVELDQYTKQLSAYGFKYNELFDMTKRLADISAGAGTDIGRLTLALGHVRSATYLTGITLRQFSMNNIPMLKMLADYYTELEGKVVSTAEVQKRISKRQVSYEDVIEQIRRLTNEGGMFYNMQEKISESLSAKFKNLKDALDIMYGEIAESSSGDFLKGIATTLTTLTRHWKEFGAVLGTAGAMFALQKARLAGISMWQGKNAAMTLRQVQTTKQLELANLRTAATYRTLTAAEQQKLAAGVRLTAEEVDQLVIEGKLRQEDLLLAVATRKLTVEQAELAAATFGVSKAQLQTIASTNRAALAFNRMKTSAASAFAGVGAGTWATIAAMVGMEIYAAWDGWVEKIDGKTKEMQDIIKSRILDLEKEQKVMKDEGKPSDNASLKARVTQMKQVLANSEAYTKSLDEQLSKTSDINKQYDILADAIDQCAEKNYRLLDVQSTVNDMIKSSSTDMRNWKDWLGVFAEMTIPFYGSATGYESSASMWDFFFNEDISTNMEQLSGAYADLRKSIDAAWEYREAIKGVIEEILNSKDVSEAFKEELRNAPFEQQIYMLANSDAWGKVVEAINTTGKAFGNTADDIDFTISQISESVSAVSERWNEVFTSDMPDAFKVYLKRLGGDRQKLRKWAIDNVEDVRMMLDAMLDQMGEKTPMIRRMFKALAYDYLTLGSVAKNITMDDIVSGRWANINELLSSKQAKKLLNEDPLADLKDSNAGAGNTGKKKKTGKTGKGGDKELEAARTRLDLAKNILEEYRKYTKDKRYSSDQALDIVSGIFGVSKEQVTDITTDYIGALTKIRDSIKATTEARKKFRQGIDKTIADERYNRETEAIKRNVDAMKEYIDTMTKQWKLYNDLFKKTGDKDFANLAFGSVMDWDDVSRAEYLKLRDLIEKRAKNDDWLKTQLGSNGGVVGFSLRMTKEEATDFFGGRNEDIVNLYMELQKLMLNNGELMLKQSAEAKAKALTEQEKLNELLREREDINNKLARLPEDRVEERQGLIWQRNAKDKEISKQRWEVFKVENDWGRVFGDLDNMSLQTIKDMIEAMNSFNLNTEDVQTVKAYQEALQKLEDQLINKDAFRQIPNLLNDVREKKEEEAAAKLALDKVMEAVKRGDAGADEAKVVVEKQYKKAQDATTKSMNNLRKAISKVANDLQQLGSSLNQLGNMIGGKGGKLLGAFGNAFSGVGSGLEGLSKASTMQGFSQVTAYVSAYTTLASTMYELNMALKDVLPNEQKLYNHYARKQAEINKMRKAVDDYRISVAKANSEEENWLYSNGMSELKTKAKEWKAAVDAYQNTYFQPQAIYQNSKSSFKKNFVPIVNAVAGAVGGAFIGAVSGSVVPLIGTIGGAIAGAIIGAGAGYARGQINQAVYDSLTYSQGYTAAYDNLRIETRRKSMFHGQRTQDLQSWVKEHYGEDLFSQDEMTGAYLINVDLMKNVMEKYGHLLVGETKETVEALMEYAEQIKEFTDSIREYVSSAISPLADNMTDAIWDWIANGTNALDSFKRYASDTFKQIAQDAVKAFMKVNILDGFKDELEGLFGAYGLGQLSEQELMTRLASLAGQIGFQFQQTLPVMQEALRVMDNAFTAQGYDIVNGNNGESGTSSTIKGVTETTADILASYMNAIRADVSMNRAMIGQYYPLFLTTMSEGNVIANAQLTQLSLIVQNTSRNAGFVEQIYELLHRVAPDGEYMRVG